MDGLVSPLGPSWMVLARPTILGQSQSGLRPKVAPGNFRKSSASETVLVSSKDKRSRALNWFMSEVFNLRTHHQDEGFISKFLIQYLCDTNLVSQNTVKTSARAKEPHESSH
jgi:hypothetical protein